MSIEGNTSNLRAPEERNVYSKRESAPFSRFPFLKPQRGGMFIARGMHQIHKSPRGATGEPGGTKIGT